MNKFMLIALFGFLVSAGCSGPKGDTVVSEPCAPKNELSPPPKVEMTEIGHSRKSVLEEPKVTYTYKLGLMREKTKTYELVNYPDGPRNVPVINGYVPKVFETVYPNGEKHITYDYRNRVEHRMIPPANKD